MSIEPMEKKPGVQEPIHFQISQLHALVNLGRDEALTPYDALKTNGVHTLW
jgi:hypothetical protein